MRIDCDIHPGLEGTRTTLLPYLDDHWKEQVTSRGIDGLDLMSYPPNMPLSCRPDWRPKQGKPGSNFEMLKAQALDGFGSTLCHLQRALRRPGRVRSLHGGRAFAAPSTTGSPRSGWRAIPGSGHP